MALGASHTSSKLITQNHLELIAKLYDLPLHPEGWQTVLDEFGSIVNAALVGIAAYDPIYIQHNLNAISSGIGPSFLEEQRKFIADNPGYESAFAKMSINPKREFIEDLEMLELDNIEDYAARPMVQWISQKFDIFHGTASCLNLDRAWTDILFVMFSSEHGPVSEEEKKIGNFFLDHFAKTVELSRTFTILKSRFNAVLTALDRFHIGVFILSPNGSVVLKNKEADRLVDAGDGITLSREGQLLSTDDGPREMLKDAITKAVYTAQAQQDYAETQITLPRRSGEDPYLVEVAPIRDHGEIDSQFTGCLVYVIDPTRSEVVSTEGMQTLYGLTRSESEVCRLVAQGLETDDIADARGLTRETVRYYIKQILNKTGTNNRSQLVRLALNINLPMDPASKEQ